MYTLARRSYRRVISTWHTIVVFYKLNILAPMRVIPTRL